MNQKQIIAVIEERIKLASSVQTKTAYEIVLGHIKAQPLYTLSEISTIAKDAHDASTIDLDFDYWWSNYKEQLALKFKK